MGRCARKNAIHGEIEAGSQLYTDEFGAYSDLDGLFYRHSTVNHSAGEFVRGSAHTNSIESVWAVLKRGLQWRLPSRQRKAPQPIRR